MNQGTIDSLVHEKTLFKFEEGNSCGFRSVFNDSFKLVHNGIVHSLEIQKKFSIF